jgi:hypothetical protein
MDIISSIACGNSIGNNSAGFVCWSQFCLDLGGVGDGAIVDTDGVVF